MGFLQTVLFNLKYGGAGQEVYGRAPSTWKLFHSSKIGGYWISKQAGASLIKVKSRGLGDIDFRLLQNLDEPKHQSDRKVYARFDCCPGKKHKGSTYIQPARKFI